MPEPPVDPELALPWQKLAAALADVLRVPPADTPPAGLDPHEERVARVASALAAKGVLDPAEVAARMAALAQKLAGDKDRAPPKVRFSNAGPNDIGGMPGGPVDPSAGHVEDWERLAVALSAALSAHGIGNVHQRRRAAEALGDDYHRLAYFERAVQAQCNLLFEQRILTRSELDRRIAQLRGRR
jgi:hypothetical protein